MRFAKTVSVVAVAERKVRKNDGSGENVFYDLEYFVPGEGVGKVGLSGDLAVPAAQLVGQSAVLDLSLAPDSRTSWLYRVEVLSVKGAKAAG